MPTALLALASDTHVDQASGGADPGAVLLLVGAVSFALVVSFLCSIFESVLLSVSRGKVAKMAKGGSRSGRILEGWKSHDIEVPIASILILNTVAHTVGSAVAGSSYNEAFGGAGEVVFLSSFTVAVLLFTEIIPKTLGVSFANRLAAPVTAAVWVLTVVLRPVLFVTSWMSRKLTGDHRRPVTSIEEIRLLAAIGHQEGDVGPRFASLIEGAASLRELTVHDVMVPRGTVAFLSGNKSLDDNFEIIRGSGHSRFPFTPTGDLDDVDGVVLAKVLLFHDHDSDDDAREVDWKPLKSALVVVPETKPLDEVLRLFQEQRKHLAIVVDEFGGTQGVVTLEDVLEEIVGEIEDEHDPIETLIIKRKDGSLMCDGTAETRKVFKELGIDRKSDMVSIGGLVSDLLGRMPKRGDTVHFEGFRFKVAAASARRAERIEVTVAPEPSSTGESEPPEEKID